MLVKDNAERKITKRPQNISCSNHPHNYYLEFLSETGIIGTGLMLIFFLILLKDSFNYLKKYNQQNNPGINLLIPIIILLFIEIWPVKCLLFELQEVKLNTLTLVIFQLVFKCKIKSFFCKVIQITDKI